MRAQTAAAIADADVILFLIDARAGVVPADQAFADLVRKAGKPVVVVANKSEGRAQAHAAYEAFALGLGEPVAISAEHGEGLADLYEAVRAIVPAGGFRAATGDTSGTETPDGAARDAADDATPSDRPIRVAVVGRPNAGKSTLVNRLIGSERLLTGPEAGITRDAIAVEAEWEGRQFLVFDTAGLRKRSKVEEKLEKLSNADAIEAIRFAEVVVLLIDARATFEEQDLRIADLVEREGRALVIGLNKWDLTEGEPGAIAKGRAEADHWLPQLKGLPVVAVSGLTGFGLDRLMQSVIAIHAIWNRRLPTHALNRWLESALAAHPPPAVAGRRLRLNYMTQPKARPPSFVLFCTRADALPEAYRRYLVNGLREYFDLPGTPIRLTLREKVNPYAGRARRKAR
jgi:GTP-binding protein